MNENELTVSVTLKNAGAIKEKVGNAIVALEELNEALDGMEVETDIPKIPKLPKGSNNIHKDTSKNQ